MPIDPCVDITLSLVLSNGKPQLAAELLDMLLTELPHNHHVISNAFAESRFDDALEWLHKLHGTCCYCGVPRLKQTCKTLEQQLRAQICQPDPENLRHFDEAVYALLAWHQTHDIRIVFSLDK